MRENREVRPDFQPSFLDSDGNVKEEVQIMAMFPTKIQQDRVMELVKSGIPLKAAIEQLRQEDITDSKSSQGH